MNTDLFARMLDAMQLRKPESVERLRGQRFITLTRDTTQTDLEREYLSSFRAERSFEDTLITWVKVESTRGVKLIFSGFDLDIEESLDVRLATAAEFLYFVDLFSMSPRMDLALIENVLGTGSRSDAHYQGHDLEQMAVTFNPIYVVDGPQVQNECISHLVRNLFSVYDRSQKAALNRSIKEKLLGLPWVSCRLAEAELTSSIHYAGPLSFLSVYLMLEGLYFEAAIKPLYEAVNPGVDAESFYSAVEAQLDWRPREIVALSKLIQQSISEATLNGVITQVTNEQAIEVSDFEKKLST